MQFKGLEFFPFPSNFNASLKMLEIEFHNYGIAVYVKLLQNIFYGQGYYLEVSRDLVLVIKQEINVEIDMIEDIIKSCVERGIFDKEKYENYNILTNEEIQKDFLHAIKRRKKIFLNENYIMPNIKTLLENEANEEVKNSANKKMNTENEEMQAENENVQTFLNIGNNRIGENSIEDNSIVEHRKKNNKRAQVGDLFFIEQDKECENENFKFLEKGDLEFEVQDASDYKTISGEDFALFKSRYPEKSISKSQKLPNWFDMNELFVKIEESDFLSNANNISFSWLIKNLESVLAGKYKTFKNEKSDIYIDIDSL